MSRVYHYRTHFTEEKTEAQKAYVTAEGYTASGGGLGSGPIHQHCPYHPGQRGSDGKG